MTPEEVFALANLTATINTLPTIPTRLGSIFQVRRQSQIAVVVDEKSGRLSLVPAGDRRGPGAPTKNPDRRTRTFSTIHLPTTGFVLAEDNQGLRGFGSEDSTQPLISTVNDRLQEMKNNLVATREHLRVGAVKGQIIDADGSTVIEDLFDAFGVTQEEEDMNLASNATPRTSLMAAKRKAEDAIGATALITGWQCIASPSFFDALVENENVKRIWEGWQAAQDRLGGDVRKGFMFGEVEFVEYGAKVGGHAFIADGEAYMYPRAPGLMVEAIAPANYSETVNTLGLEYYAKSEPMRFGKGFDLEAQTNPLPLNLVPKSSIKLLV